jgi:hypothetical protein
MEQVVWDYPQLIYVKEVLFIPETNELVGLITLHHVEDLCFLILMSILKSEMKLLFLFYYVIAN